MARCKMGTFYFIFWIRYGVTKIYGVTRIENAIITVLQDKFILFDPDSGRRF